MNSLNTQHPDQDPYLIAQNKDFDGWTALNDTIMGGSSQAICKVTSQGLLLEGVLVEEGGGFVSCRSHLYTPPLNLSKFKGIRLIVDGEGRTLKLAIASRDQAFGLSRFISGGLRWIAEFKTRPEGTSLVDIPFSSLQPTVRAKPVRLPVRFDVRGISQFQLLHSKFGQPGKLNSNFRSGPINILLRSISGFS